MLHAVFQRSPRLFRSAASAARTVVAVSVFLPGSAAWAAEGDLDTTFGPADGLILSETPCRPDGRVDTEALADGRFLLAGVRTGQPEGYVARFDASGNLDETFGTSGVTYTGVHSSTDSDVALAVQTDGKCLVAGVASNGNPYLVRFDDNGDLDPSFGIAGVADPGLQSDLRSAVALSVQSDGKILMAGIQSGDVVYVARFDETGALDSSFAIAGVSSTGMTSTLEGGLDMEIRSNGDIVVAGVDSGTQEIFATRLDSAGQPDFSFGVSGTARTGIVAPSDIEVGVAIQSDGGVLLGGSETGSRQAYFARFTAAGVLDTGFGSAGLVFTGIAVIGSAGVEVQVQPDDKILFCANANASDAFLHRYDTSGERDFTLGPTGVIAPDIPLRNRTDVSLALRPNGGFALASIEDGPNKGFIATYSADGSPDGHVGIPTGIAILDIMSENESGVDVLSLPDGKFLVAGWDVFNFEAYVTRFDASGFPDPTFGTGGTVWTDTPTEVDSKIVLALQPDGKIVLASYDPTVSENYLTRFDSVGSVDPTFGTAGVVHTGITSDPFSGIDLAVGASGEIAFAGINWGTPFVARFDAEGVFDTSYGDAGIALLPLQVSPVGDVALSIPPDDQILFAGIESGGEGFVGRLNTDGWPDPTFADHDMFAWNGFFSEEESGVDLTVQPDGKVLFAGVDRGIDEAFVLRLEAEGLLDQTFGSGGIAHTGVNSASWSGVRLGLQEDGKVLIAGAQGFSERFVARLDAGGALDPTFGTTGVTVLDFQVDAESAVALALQSDGRILLAGHSLEFHANFVARLEGTPVVPSSTEPIDIPAETIRLTSYPNPFTERASVHFKLPTAGPVALDLFSVSGRRVRTLVEDHLTAGSHDVSIDAENLASGTYVLRLRTETTKASQRIVFMR